MTLLKFRHHVIITGFVGSGLIGASTLAVWPQADAARLIPHEERGTIALPPGTADAATKVHSSARQIPLSALAFNPFAHRVDAARPADADRLQLLSALQRLRLDSLLCTDFHRSCSINGESLSEGDSVGLFVIEKISPASVALKNGVYRFELRLQP